jgi:acetyl esterase
MDPQAQHVLDMIAKLSATPSEHPDDAHWLTDFRCGVAGLRAFAPAPEPVHQISNIRIGGLAVRLYRPKPGRLPLLLHMHGGGAIAGSVDGHDPALRALANRTGWLVAAPLYRLAPEARFPAQLDDGWSALAHLTEHAYDYDIDAGRVAISGDSIGGALATALATLVRDRGGPAIKGQILIYPNTDLRENAPHASLEAKNGIIINLTMLKRQVDLYLQAPADRENHFASPLLNQDLTGLAPALVITCEDDPLDDEGLAYAKRLKEAGVTVTVERFEGMIHAFLQMGGYIDATERLLVLMRDWLAGV